MLIVYLIGLGGMLIISTAWAIWIEIITGLGGGKPLWKYVLMVLTWSVFWPIALAVMLVKSLFKRGG